MDAEHRDKKKAESSAFWAVECVNPFLKMTAKGFCFFLAPNRRHPCPRSLVAPARYNILFSPLVFPKNH